MEHIKTECDTEWLENDGNATGGNASIMVMHQVGSGNHYVIKLLDTKANVTFISNKMVLMLKWEDDPIYPAFSLKIPYHLTRNECGLLDVFYVDKSVYLIEYNPHSHLISKE
jgi:hypothetical protein